MAKITKNRNNVVPILMMIFISLQPLLDLSTLYSKLVMNLSYTPGIIIRMLFMIVGSFYVIVKSFKENNKKYFSYLSILAFFFICNLIISYYNKPTFNLFSEITSIAKIVYFVLMFIVFILAFKDLKASNITTKYFPKNVVISQFIVSLSMIVSYLSDSSIEAYDGILKTGNSGWFFAANELGTLLAICFPILIWNALNSHSILHLLLNWLIVLGSLYSLVAIGTKVGYLAVLITFVVLTVIILLSKIIKTTENIKELQFLKGVLVFTTFGMFIYLTPMMPVTNNTNSHISLIERTNEVQENSTVKKSIKDIINRSDQLDGNEAESEGRENLAANIVFSGRDGFLQKHKNDYNNAGFLQKLFGMGYSANYTLSPLMIERDFHDVFFQYGWLGFFLIFFPFVLYIVRLIMYVISNFLSLLNIKYMMIFSGILLGLGVAFISGHTITAPAVSSYLTLLMAYLVVDLGLYNRKFNQ